MLKSSKLSKKHRSEQLEKKCVIFDFDSTLTLRDTTRFLVYSFVRNRPFKFLWCSFFLMKLILKNLYSKQIQDEIQKINSIHGTDAKLEDLEKEEVPTWVKMVQDAQARKEYLLQKQKSHEEAQTENENEEDLDWRYLYSNEKIFEITNSDPIKDFCQIQHLEYIAHVTRLPNSSIQKQSLFRTNKKKDMHATLGLNMKKLPTYQKSNFKKLCKTKADSCLYWKTSWALNTLQQCHEEEDDDDDV